MPISLHSRKPPVSVKHFGLPNSLANHARVVQLADRSDWPTVTALPVQCWRTLDALQPQVLIGSANELIWLGGKITAGLLKLDSLDRAVVVSMRIGTPSLTSETRDRLWRAFQLPVFEIFQAESGDVLAYECEAHDGWHVAPGAVFESIHERLHVRQGRENWDSGLNAQLRSAKCGCGESGMMIMAAVEQHQRFFAAAS